MASDMNFALDPLKVSSVGRQLNVERDRVTKKGKEKSKQTLLSQWYVLKIETEWNLRCERKESWVE